MKTESGQNFNIDVNSFMNFFKQPLNTFNYLQNKRLPWFIMGITPFILNMLAHYVFQIFMGLDACEMCVYIRFSMFCIFAGCMIAFINPANKILRVAGGYMLAGYGIIQGTIWDIKLEYQHILYDRVQSGMDLFSAGATNAGCSYLPTYPLGLPLHEWFPSWFQPTASCGIVDWYLFGFNMAECLFLFYGIYCIAIILMVISFIKSNLFKQ